MPSKNHYYSLASLTLRSNIPLPSLAPAPHRRADINIRLSDLLKPKPSFNSLGPGWFEIPDGIHINIPGTAQFRISNGCRIDVEPSPFTDWSKLRLYLLGTALGALWHQRGLLPLHASCLTRGPECLAVAGDSGMGKTTLAAMMLARGWRILTDDVCVVSLDGGGTPTAHPGPNELRLWADTARMVGVTLKGRRRVHSDHAKYHVALNNPIQTTPKTLTRLYILADGEAFDCHRLTRAQALAELIRHTYRPFLLTTPEQRARHFQYCAALARRLPVYRFTRPRDPIRLDECADFIANHSVGACA